MRKLAIIAVVGVACLSITAASTSKPGPRPVQYCRTAADTAAQSAMILNSLLHGVAPGSLHNYGFLAAPDSLVIVTNEGTCESIVDAYNAFIAPIDSTQIIPSAYVFTDGVGYIFPVFLEGTSSFSDAWTADSTFAIRHGFGLLH